MYFHTSAVLVLPPLPWIIHTGGCQKVSLAAENCQLQYDCCLFKSQSFYLCHLFFEQLYFWIQFWTSVAVNPQVWITLWEVLDHVKNWNKHLSAKASEIELKQLLWSDNYSTVVSYFNCFRYSTLRVHLNVLFIFIHLPSKLHWSWGAIY